jgi:hypothetical protein
LAQQRPFLATWSQQQARSFAMGLPTPSLVTSVPLAQSRGADAVHR